MAQDKQQNKYSGIGSIGVGGQSILKGILGSILGAGQDEETLTPEMVLPKKDSIDAGDAVDMRRMLEMIHKGDLFPEDRDKNGQPIIRGETMHIEATSPYLKQGKPLDKIPHDEPIPQPDLGIAPSNVDLNKLMLPPVIPTLAKQPQKAKVAPNVWETKTPADINTPLLTPNQPTTQTSGVDSIHKGDETKVAPKIEGVGEPSQQDFMSALAAAPHQSVSMPIGGGASGTVEQGKPLSKEPGKHNVAEKILGGLLHALIGKIGADQNRPQLTAPVNSDEYYRQRQLQTSYDAAHPKYHGILGTIGNIAGDMIAPNIMANIPGTVANQEIRAEGEQEGLNRDLALQSEQAKLGETKAQTREANATAAEKENALKTSKPVGEPIKGADGFYQRYVSPGGKETVQKIQGLQPNKEYEFKDMLGPDGQKHTFAIDKSDPTSMKMLGVSETKPENAPVPKEKVASFGYDLKADHPDLTPQQISSLSKQLGPNPTQTDYEKVLARADNAQRSAEAMKDRRTREVEVSAQRAEARSRAGENDLNREIDKAQSDIKSKLDKSDDKIQELQQATQLLEEPNGVKDAMAVVKTLIGTAGGQGTGLRINQAELNNLASARGWVDSAEVKLNNVFNPGQYEKLSSTQRDAMKGILSDVYNLVEGKNKSQHSAYTQITNATSVGDIRKAQTDLSNSVSQNNQSLTPNKVPSFSDWKKKQGKQ